MTTKNPKRPVRMAFEASTVRVAIADILPLRVVRPELKSAKKYLQIAASAISNLKKMLPLRQIEAVELMVAMNKFTASYAHSLLAATPQAELVEPSKPRRMKGLTEKQMLLMQRESANLDRQFKLVEQTYGNDHLDLVLVNGYVAKLLANARVVKFLTQHYAEILAEFQKIVDIKSAAA